MDRSVEKGQVWRHYRGWEYFVEELSIADQNYRVGQDVLDGVPAIDLIFEGDSIVRYKNGKGQSFFRSKESFLGVKSSDEGTNFYRFERVS